MKRRTFLLSTTGLIVSSLTSAGLAETGSSPLPAAAELKQTPAGLVEFDGWIVSREDKLALLQTQVRTLEGAVASKDAEIAKLMEELEVIRSSRSWRIIRHIRRWVDNEG